MVEIHNCCHANLRRSFTDEILGEDITNQLTIGTTPTLLLSIVNLSRRLIKIYSVQYSDPAALLWIRHSSNVSIDNASFPLPVRRLYINSSQASRPLSVMCTTGTAIIKFTVVNKS